MRAKAAAAVLALSLVLSACGEGETGVFRGVFFYGFETSDFRVCGSNEIWWASGNLKPLIDVTPAPGSRGVYAEIQGELSPPGSYGHLGMYPREIEIRKVRRVLAVAEADCF